MTTLIKQLSLTFAVAATLALSASPALATPYFTFSFSGQNEVGGGSFSAVSNGNGSYTVISGTEWDKIDGVTETLNLIANPAGPNGTTYSPSGAFYYDDQFTPNSDPMLEVGGLMFTGTGGVEINIWSTGPGSYVFDRWQDGSYGPGEQSITFTAEDPPAGGNGSVPEPATLALLGLGILGLAASRRKA